MNEPGNDDALLVRDGTEGTNLEVEVEYPPFDLENVGRAIARMALFHLPAGPGSSLRHVLEWVRGDVSWQPAIYEVLLPGGVTPNGVFMTLEPSPEYKSHTLLACLVCSCVAYFVPFPSTDWTVIEPPWQIVLEPFSVFAGSLEINRFPSQLGRIHGLRRTLHMKQAEGSEKPQR